MGKTARMLAAPLAENMAVLAGRVAYDPRFWQRRESGDYVNVCTGELKDADDFDFDGDNESDVFHPDAGEPWQELWPLWEPNG